MMVSGLICNPDIHWIVFHGSFDFGYFMKLVSGDNLPQTVPEFFSTLKIFFPKIYDIKAITEKITSLGKSLRTYGNNLEVTPPFFLLTLSRLKELELRIKQVVIQSLRFKCFGN